MTLLPSQSDSLRNLNAPCPVCARVSGDHTLREWSVCIGQPTTDLPFEPVPDDMAEQAAEAVRAQFQLDPDLIIADHVTVRAVTLAGSSGTVDVRFPALIHEFQVGLSERAPVTVAKVIYIGNTDAIRQYGRLVRDSANGAANAGERA
jgi:hypothetical protein